MSEVPTTPVAVTRPAIPPIDVDPSGVVLRLLLWGIAATTVALVHNRLWASPNLDAFSTIAAKLGSDPFRTASTSDYLLTNLSLPVLARTVGMTDPHRYALLHLLVLLVALGWCVTMAQHRFGYRTARTLVVVLAAAPGVTVVFEWLGQPDALTFPLGVALVLVQRRWTFVALAVLAGFTHPEQAVLVVCVAAIVRALVVPPGDELAIPAPRQPIARVPRLVASDLVPGLIGVIIARLGIELYLRAFEVGQGRARSDYLRLGTELLIEHHGRAPLSLVYLLWGPLWLVIIGAAALRILARRRGDGPDEFGWSWAVLGTLSLAALLPTMVTLDETRVYAVLTAPVLVGAVILLARELQRVHERALLVASIVLLAFTLVVPGGFTAGQDAWATQIPISEFVRFLDTGQSPTSLFYWLLGPFDFVFPNVDTG